MVRVKICGITNVEDARACVAAGADMLGFNFYSASPRYISREQARDIAAGIPSTITRVGVFVNESVDAIAKTTELANLNSVQLHGDFEATLIPALRNLLPPNVEVIRAFRVSPGFSIDPIRDTPADAILLDAFVPGKAGGTGIACDWGVAKEATMTGRAIYLAGGLSPDNVSDAVKQVRPYAVDACSLLESAAGRKDHDRVRQFIFEAKRNE